MPCAMSYSPVLRWCLSAHFGVIPSSGNYVGACFSSGLPYSETDSSRPVAAAALAIPDLAALIFSAYCSGIRVDFHPPACVIAANPLFSRPA
jgi:hypothetical protein